MEIYVFYTFADNPLGFNARDAGLTTRGATARELRGHEYDADVDGEDDDDGASDADCGDGDDGDSYV